VKGDKEPQKLPALGHYYCSGGRRLFPPPLFPLPIPVGNDERAGPTLVWVVSKGVVENEENTDDGDASVEQ